MGGVFMAMAFLCFVIIQGNLCGINIVKRLLWDMIWVGDGWCWGWARTYSHLTILYRMVYRAAKTWDGFRGFWEICRSNKGLLANRSVLSFQSSSIEQTNPCQTSLKGMSKYHPKNILYTYTYIYILLCPCSWGSMSVSVFCRNENRSDAWPQSIRFGIVSLTPLHLIWRDLLMSQESHVPWLRWAKQDHSPRGPVPLWLKGYLSHVMPAFFYVVFILCEDCEVWSGKIWCWIWTLADRCGSLPRSCEFSDVLC